MSRYVEWLSCERAHASRLAALLRRMIFVLAVVTLLLPLSRAQACDQPPRRAVVSITPEETIMRRGQTRTLAVRVQRVHDLYGVDIIVTFNPQVVEVVDADPSKAGVQIVQGPFLDPGFTVYNTADNQRGEIRFTMTQLNPSEAKSGNGVLFYITLRGREVGRTRVTITKAEMATRDGEYIEILTRFGKVIIRR